VLGKNNDGGYIICEIPQVEYDIFITGGVAGDISFEEELCNIYHRVKYIEYLHSLLFFLY
jgi:hypothetical protein